jgi:sigma-B regulation protein RsbU (phosphoserine phosphatase)
MISGVQGADGEGPRDRDGSACKVDLFRMRHELRTPINHILGYSELLLEEGQFPTAHLEDLHRIHTGGRELQVLIARYFDEAHFFQKRDLHQLYHELRTPVNHIIGYCDLLMEQAEEPEMRRAIPDLHKIRDAAANWLALVESYLIEPAKSASLLAGEAGIKTPQAIASNLESAVAVPEPKSARSAFHGEGAILVVDDDESSREMLARRLRRCGYTVSAVSNGGQGLALARDQGFDLVMLDMIMPGLDGFHVLASLKADPALRETPVIMLSALDEENGIARCIEMGAEDYLAKPFNSVFLHARIGACLEKKRLRDQERATHAALRQSQEQLAAELGEAAAYLRSLLPGPLSGAIETEWCFQPCQQLGGDAFGYHWIDRQHFALYLLDVCGHGVGAALLSVSALNTLRAQTLPDVDFRRPAQVLAALNRTYRMEDHNQLYFTIWYGVYRLDSRELVYGSGGHPPALLFAKAGPQDLGPVELQTPCPAIGCLEEAPFVEAVQPVEPGARLLVLSDGVFEILRPDDLMDTWRDFVASLASPHLRDLRPPQRLQRAQELRGAEWLEDDFSLVEARFR